MNEFIGRFKNYRNSHLLKIARGKSEYQPEAIEAAKSILESRQLTEEEMQAAKAEIANEQSEKDNLAQKKAHIQNEVKDFGVSVVNTINPVQKTAPTATKIIKTTSLFLGLLFVYMVVKDFHFFKFLLTDSSAKWDMTLMFFFLPPLWVLITTFLFYKEIKTGWILLAAFTIYKFTTTVLLIFMEMLREPSVLPIFEHLFPATPISTFVITLVFFGGLLWLISKSNIREIYRVDSTVMRATIAITATVTLIIFGIMS